MALFIKCMCDDDIRALVIEGEPTEEELSAAWQAVYQEYLELSGTAGTDYQTTLTMEIMQLFIKHTMVVESVELLRKFRFDELVHMLKASGHNFPFNHNDLEAYHKDLDRVLNRSKSLLVQKEKKEAQLAQLHKGQEGNKITREYFDTRLNALSIHYKYHIDENIVTVSRYVGMLNQYFKDCERLNAAHGGHNR